MKNLVIVLLVILIFYSQSYCTEPQTIFFYNPDSNIQNYLPFMKFFKNYFNPKISKFKIQPFVNFETLVKIMLTRQPGFFIVPAWNFDLIHQDKSFARYTMKKLLKPEKNAVSYYKKIILAKKDSKITKLTDLSGEIASASLGLKSIDFLDTFLFKGELDYKKVIFIWTKKDMDALLAIKFHQVKVSIITDRTYYQIKATTPSLVEDLKIIKESQEIPEILLIHIKNNTTDKLVNEYVKMFLEMHKSKAGKKILDMMGYEKWIPVQ